VNLISIHRVRRVSQVPNVERWVLIIIVSYDELGRNFGVPNHLSSLGSLLLLRRVCTLIVAATPVVIEKLSTIICISSLRWLCKLENGF
jgi:hypothetical protein